jgi:hypothetical protein
MLLTPCLISAPTYLSFLSPAHAFHCDVYSSTSKNTILNCFCSDPSSRQCNSVMGNFYTRTALRYFPPLRLSRHSYIDIHVSVKKYMKMTILWVTASCIVMKVYRRFRGAPSSGHDSYLHLALLKKTKAVPLHAKDLGDGGEWSASRPGRPLPPGKGPPVPILQGAGWAPEPVWTQRLSSLAGIEPRSPGRPARSQTLY